MTTRAVWLTDIHLNFVTPDEVDAFLASVAAQGPDIVMLGGDVSESPDLIRLLTLLDERLDCPIHFVLGNHDYYFSSIAKIRAEVSALCRERAALHWLTEGGVVPLGSSVGLVGHDGWADARLGDYERSMVMMNDYRLIEELARYDKRHRWPVLKALGREAADHVRRVLPQAIAEFDEVIFLTHVPPLPEACWHEGRISNAEWMPHFTCLAVGEALLEIMSAHPEKRLTVLCGHTHGRGEAHPLANVTIYTGGAEYGHPGIERVFEFS